MLEITIKTMDSQTRSFQVPEMITVREFKHRIAESVNIPVQHQRLIFQGRVLGDDFKLTNDHHEKVFHLVQRPPVSAAAAASTASGTQSQATSSHPQPHQQIPTSIFNPAQLSQVLIHQALGGLGNMLNGGGTGPVISGTMHSSNLGPAGRTDEPTMNIRIEMGSTNITPTSTSAPRVTSHNHGTHIRPHHHHNHAGVSAPRHRLDMANRIIAQLCALLDRLESNSTEGPPPPAADVAGGATPASGGDDVTSGQMIFAAEYEMRMDNAGDPQRGAASNDGQASSNTSSSPSQPAANSPPQQQQSANHPTLRELGTTYSNLFAANRRLEPFLNRFVDFLNTDPSFTSTSTPEYRSTATLLSSCLQAQRMLSDVHWILSNTLIPLGRTPPRHMLVHAPMRTFPAPQGSSGPRRAGATAQRGQGSVVINPTSSPNRPPAPARTPNSAPQLLIRTPNSAGQAPPSRGSAQSNPTAPSNVQQSHPRGAAAASGVINGRFFRATTMPNSAPQQQPQQQQQQQQTQQQQQQQQAGTAVRFSPAQYTVQINATIQPSINVAVGPVTSVASTAATSTTNSTATGPIPVSSSAPAAPSSTPTIPLQSMPAIPGVRGEVLQRMLQDVARSVQQQEAPGGQPVQAGVVFVQGPPGGPNQIPEEISNILSQAVYNTVYNQLSGSSSSASAASSTPQTSSSASQTASAASQTVSSTSQTVNGSSTAANLETTSQTTPATTATDTSQTATRNSPRVEVLLSGGTFGNRTSGSQAAAGPNTTQSTANQPAHNIADYIRVLGDRVAGNVPENQARNQPLDVLVQIAQELSSRLPADDIVQMLTTRDLPPDRVLEIVQSIIRDEYFGGQTPTPDEMKIRIENILSEMGGFLGEFFDGIEAVGEADLVATNLSLLQDTIGAGLRLLFHSDSTASASGQISHHLTASGSRIITVNSRIIVGGRERLRRLIRERISSMGGSGIQGPLLGMVVDHLFSSAHEDEGWERFVVNRRNDEEEEMETESKTVDKEMDDVTPMTSSSRDVTPPVMSSLPHGDNNVTTSGGEGAQPRANNEQLTPAAGDGREMEGDDWKQPLPAEWIETIESDVAKQHELKPQPPFSEAYMSGMPASKRRKVVM